jgi:hypothetical protein
MKKNEEKIYGENVFAPKIKIVSSPRAKEVTIEIDKRIFYAIVIVVGFTAFILSMYGLTKIYFDLNWYCSKYVTICTPCSNDSGYYWRNSMVRFCPQSGMICNDICVEYKIKVMPKNQTETPWIITNATTTTTLPCIKQNITVKTCEDATLIDCEGEAQKCLPEPPNASISQEDCKTIVRGFCNLNNQMILAWCYKNITVCVPTPTTTTTQPVTSAQIRFPTGCEQISDTEVMLTFNYSGVPFYSRVTSNFAIKCSQIMPNNLGIITNSVEPDNIGRTPQEIQQTK